MTATPMPAAPTAASDPLRVALQGVLDEGGGRFGGVARLARRPSPYGSSSTLEELDVVLDDGGELALVFKDLGPHARSVAAREARPSDLHDPLREIEAYRRVLAPASLSTAAFIGAVTEPALGRYWLFLERVPGVGLDQVGSVEVWAAAAAWLGRMHRSFANQTARLEGEPHLLRYDAGHFAGWARRAGWGRGPSTSPRSWRGTGPRSRVPPSSGRTGRPSIRGRGAAASHAAPAPTPRTIASWTTSTAAPCIWPCGA